jgi:hypothetical protein
VYVAKVASADEQGALTAFATTNAAAWAQLVHCAGTHAVLLALVQRQDVDVKQLVSYNPALLLSVESPEIARYAQGGVPQVVGNLDIRPVVLFRWVSRYIHLPVGKAKYRKAPVDICL